ncbi:MAG TPA: hypothetical protein VEV41_13870 [Terriglobales bacterium]|nr:hypothetical protein [Terriglobales bacterium]
MFRTSLLLLVVVCLASMKALAQGTTEEVLPAGMILQCVLDEPHFSSSTAEIGDPVLCHVGTLGVFGHSAFPRGAYLAGRFQDFRDPGRFFGKGWMELTFDRLVLPGAVTLPLSAKVVSVPHLRVDREGRIHGRGHPKRDAVGWALPILWPVKVLTLPARGPRPTVKGEVRITLRLMEDVNIPATVVASRTSSLTPSARTLSPSSQGMRSPRLWPDYKTGSEDISAVPAIPLVGSSYFAEPLSRRQLTILLLKDNTGYLATDYWLEGTQLHCSTLDGEHKVVPLGRLDLNETVRVNRERNVEIVLRSKEDGPN